MPAHGAQLLHRASMRVRFADGLTGEIGHLVRADHHCARVLRGHGLRLGQRQALRKGGGCLVRQGGLIHAGGHSLKGQLQAFQQFASVARGGRQDQGRDRHPQIVSQGYTELAARPRHRNRRATVAARQFAGPHR